MRPNSLTAPVTSLSMAFASDTSQTMADTLPPISFAVFSSVSFSRPVTITVAPRFAKPSARPRPMPRLAPETRTTWPLTENNSSDMGANINRRRENLE